MDDSTITYVVLGASVVGAAGLLTACGGGSGDGTTADGEASSAAPGSSAAIDDSGAWLVQTPHIPMKANGSGDVTAALFTAHYRRTGDLSEALARTTSSVFDLLSRTHESGRRELQLVQSQDEIAHPRMQFEVQQIR